MDPTIGSVVVAALTAPAGENRTVNVLVNLKALSKNDASLN